MVSWGYCDDPCLPLSALSCCHPPTALLGTVILLAQSALFFPLLKIQPSESVLECGNKSPIPFECFILWLTLMAHYPHQPFSRTGPNAHITRCPSSVRPEGQEPSDLEPIWHTSWEAWVVFPSHAASCNLHGVTLTSSSNSDHSTLLSSTYSFVPAHVALTVLPSDQSQASASSLSEEGLARIKDEVQWQSQKHFWGEVLFLDIYKSAEMCAILNVLCVGRGRWRCISQREMWFRGGEKATKF